MSTIEIKVPDIGDFKNVDVIEVLVKPGDTIHVDDSIVTVESEKASMEIPSSHSGVVKEIKVKLGDQVNEGSLLLLLEAEEASDTPAATTTEAPTPTPTPEPHQALAPATPSPTPQPPAPSPVPAATIPEPAPAAPGARPHASPSVRKFARELGVDLTHVQGTGSKGRITHEDVQLYVKEVMTGAATQPAQTAQGAAGLSLLPWPELNFAQYGPTEIQPLSRIKKMSGPNLHRNWVMIPHVTQYEQADVTELEAFRVESNQSSKENGIRLTILAFVIKACVYALQRHPEFNASLDETGDNLILKRYYHIGFAADTVHGLVVPVIKDADQKGVLQIAREMGELSALAREGRLSPSDMHGASFTITSLGGIGGTYFTPIINAPEVAILGLSRLNMQPVWDGEQFNPRLILPLSLSYDHRVIDGAQGTRFTAYIAALLSDMRKTLL